MDLTQLLTDLLVIAGVLLFATLAIVPLWIEHAAAEPQPRRVNQRQPRGGFPTTGPISRTFTSPMNV